MSDLRKQLDAARREYREMRYPGDLASDVLRPVRHWGRWLAVGGAIAAAAAIALVIRLQLAEQPTTGIVQATETTSEMSLTALPVVSLAELPAGLQLSPPAYDFSISPPSFSLVSDESENSQEPSTTQETT